MNMVVNVVIMNMVVNVIIMNMVVSIAMQHHLTISPKPFMTVLLIFVVVEPPRFICAFTLYMAMQAIVSGNELQFACDYTRRQDSHHATLHLVILTG